MIATIIKAEWRISRAKAEPYLAMELEMDGDERWLFLSPAAIIGWNALLRQCLLPTIDYDYQELPSKLVGKIISARTEWIHFKDRHFQSVMLNVNWLRAIP
jgi:hypothetical protein